MTSKRLNLSVETDSPELVTRAAEVLARALAGLVLEGMDASMFVYDTDDEDDDS